MKDKLKPCPFCGSDIVHSASKNFGEPLYKKVCTVCGSSGGWWRSEEKADEQWNKRAVIIPHMGKVS